MKYSEIHTKVGENFRKDVVERNDKRWTQLNNLLVGYTDLLLKRYCIVPSGLILFFFGFTLIPVSLVSAGCDEIAVMNGLGSEVEDTRWLHKCIGDVASCRAIITCYRNQVADLQAEQASVREPALDQSQAAPQLHPGVLPCMSNWPLLKSWKLRGMSYAALEVCMTEVTNCYATGQHDFFACLPEAVRGGPRLGSG